MKNLVNCLAKHLGELVLVGGAAVVAVGAGMIYLPAGLITGGSLAIAGAVLSLWERVRRNEPAERTGAGREVECRSERAGRRRPAPDPG